MSLLARLLAWLTPRPMHDDTCTESWNHPGCVVVSSNPECTAWEYHCPKCGIYWLEDK